MISVIVPVYNVEKYLDKCLYSIVNNTYRDLEIICVNDGSTDGSPAILQEWQARDPRIAIVSHENRGLPEARNSGLEVAAGDYTAFIDADDYVHPLYFQSMLDCMEKTGADMVVAGVKEFAPGVEIAADSAVEPKFYKLTASEYFKNGYVRHTVWGRLLRRRDTQYLRFPPEVDAQQDTLYNLRLIGSLKSPIVFAANTQLYYYLQRPDSLVKTRTYKTAQEISDWYIANRQHLFLQKDGEWSWMLLLHCIKAGFSSRYMASLYKDRGAFKHAHYLLRAMLKDLLKNKQIPLGSRLAHAILMLSPKIYHCARIIRDPSVIQLERKVRNSINTKR